MNELSQEEVSIMTKVLTHEPILAIILLVILLYFLSLSHS